MKKVNEHLWRFYELSISELDNAAEIHRKRLEFYTGLISALFSGLLLGFFNAKEWYHYLMLCSVPCLTFIISFIGLKDTGRVYVRMLEGITVRAKMEHKLGLVESTSRLKTEKRWWVNEPMIASRHLENRSKYNTSSEFISAQSKQGLQKWVRILFRAFMGLSVVLFSALIFMAFLQY